MLDHEMSYAFSPTVGALQMGEKVVLGGNLRDFVSIDMRTVSPQVLSGFNQVAEGRKLGEIAASLDPSDRISFLTAIAALAARGLIEPKRAKQDAIQRAGKDGVDYERFDRQINLFKHEVGTYEGALEVQKKIANARVSLIGLGGCGSYIFYTLAAMGIGRLRAFEFDVVERSNLSRQILYTHADIGRRKIDVAAERAPLISPTTIFEFHDYQLLTVDDCETAFDDVDLVISAADLPRPDFFNVINAACFKHRTPTMYAGSMATNAIVGPLLVPGTTRCRTCVLNVAQQERSSNHPFVNAMIDGYTTTLIDPYNAAAGAIAALEAVKFLTGFQECRILGRQLFMSFDDYSLMPHVPSHSGSCSVCN